MLAPAHPVAQLVAEGVASLSSQQPAMHVTQEAAMAPSVEAPAVVQSNLTDAEAMELFDQTLADEAIIAMLNESLYSDDDSDLGPDGNLDTIRSLEKAPESLRYDHPVSIYQRYITARDAWYESLPIGSDKKDRLYRKAQGLPIRYSKID